MKLAELPEARGTWKFFDLICSTPHPSGGERKLAGLLADKAREAGDDKLFEAIAEMAGPAMARAQVVERKFHERQAARRAARAKSGRG